jgi:quercetin dioxygenase-like cupin family protein
VIKLTGEHTDGRLTVVEVTIPPGRMCPPHVHHREEETFVVLDGHATFYIGEQQVEAGPGDMIVGTRDLPHHFQAGDEGARLLFLLTPSGLEGLIREQSVPATQRTLPPKGAVPPPDLDAMRQIARNTAASYSPDGGCARWAVPTHIYSATVPRRSAISSNRLRCTPMRQMSCLI